MSKNQMVSVGHIEINQTEFNASINEKGIPVLPTRNLVLFPGMVMPINLVRESSRRLAEHAERNRMAVVVACQRDESVDTPRVGDLCRYGVVAQVLKVIQLPDDSALAVLMGRPEKVEITGGGEPTVADALCVAVSPVKEPKARINDTFMQKLKYAREVAGEISGEHLPGASLPKLPSGEEKPELAVNVLCALSQIPVGDKMELLAAKGLRARVDLLIDLLVKQKEANRVREEIERGAHQRMSERQRNAMLELQMEEIRRELYGEGHETADLREKLKKLPVTDEVHDAIEREIGKLEHLNPQSPDYQMQYSYVETVLELPWGKYSNGRSDFRYAEKELDATHFGLEKVKERVLEQLAILIHSPFAHSPIICLVGPPGVGKTSLGKSIANALGREFRRVSLGGLHDESEIRGHRRTYVGAMPGRIIDAMRRAGTMNPVIMLDEIDKVSRDYKGNPAAALLEVLDPEQNVKFHDNYVDMDFDLSDVLFITTANTLAPIDAPLLDRMEVIHLSGYSAQEKLTIARNHLLPRLRKDMGLEVNEWMLPDSTVSYVIDNYTSESGVRQLQKMLASLLRKYVRGKVSGKTVEPPVSVEEIRALLGVETNSHDTFLTDETPGVVTGLAWTAAGGEILFIEAVLTPGKEDGRLTLTGNLGDVMKESAAIAHRYVKAHASELGIDSERVKDDVHIHVPEGAIPKDGPSAGITMTTAIVSAMTGLPVRRRMAMTGEMTLRGKVLPVGGIKDKILAAKRAGITDIVICHENRRHVEEIKAEYLEGLTFHYVANMGEVIALALA